MRDGFGLYYVKTRNLCILTICSGWAKRFFQILPSEVFESGFIYEYVLYH